MSRHVQTLYSVTMSQARILGAAKAKARSNEPSPTFEAHLLIQTSASATQRSRSRFLLLLVVDALLSVTLVVSLFHYVESHRRNELREIELQRAGAISMTRSQIVAQLRFEGRRAFWLGPQSHARYTASSVNHRQLTITYLSRGDDLYLITQPKMTVDTYQNRDSFENEEHLRLDSPNMQRFKTTLGNSVFIDPARVDSEFVTLPNAPFVLVIHYVHATSRQEMLANADKLVELE